MYLCLRVCVCLGRYPFYLGKCLSFLPFPFTRHRPRTVISLSAVSFSFFPSPPSSSLSYDAIIITSNPFFLSFFLFFLHLRTGACFFSLSSSYLTKLLPFLVRTKVAKQNVERCLFSNNCFKNNFLNYCY